MKPIIEVSNLSKKYRLGVIGARSLRDEVQILWWKVKQKNGCAQDFGTQVANQKQKTPDCPLTADKLQKRNNDFWALKNVSFEVKAGEIMGIIGRNGAGKSTLLKILSRVTEPTEGEATLRGRLASLLEVGTGFHPELSGRENIYLNGTILGMKTSEISRKFDEIVAFAEIERFIDTPVKRYSSGMYVRLAFSVAAHLNPEILLVDEVLAVGDFVFQAKCIQKMKQLTNSGKTILFVSHNLYTLQTLCGTGLLLDRGEVAFQGSMQEAIAAYKSIAGEVDREEVRPRDQESGDVLLRSLELDGGSIRHKDVSGLTDIQFTWEFELKRAAVLHFGFSIKSIDGIYVSGLSTFVEEMPRYFETGIHRCGISVPGLNLPSGSYKIALAITNENGIATHLYLDSAATLFVSRPFRFDGIIGLQHEWLLPSSPAGHSGEGPMLRENVRNVFPTGAER